jgi:hypothetical protein
MSPKHPNEFKHPNELLAQHRLTQPKLFGSDRGIRVHQWATDEDSRALAGILGTCPATLP